MANQLLDDALIPKKVNLLPKKKEINKLMFLSWVFSLAVWFLLNTYSFPLLDNIQFWISWIFFYNHNLYLVFLILIIIYSCSKFKIMNKTFTFFFFIYIVCSIILFGITEDRFYEIWDNWYVLQLFILIMNYTTFIFIKRKFDPPNFTIKQISTIAITGLPIINLIYCLSFYTMFSIYHFLPFSIENCLLINATIISGLCYYLYTKGINWYFSKGQKWLKR